ncbi:MAG TPA: ABC transporter permease subunit [Lachnospiraceae bacterium]|nr:ABC transporter permease subunit [Lachnospiraceae bacterium]
MKMNPVYRKELKLSVRSPKIVMTILGYNIVLLIITLLAFYTTYGSRQKYNFTSFQSVLTLYIMLATIEFILLVLVIPAFTASAISGEREKQTLDILLTTRLKPFQIVIGKLASSISMMMLLVISSFPTLSVVFVIGGVQLRDLPALFLVFFVTAFFVGSIGIFFSTLFRNTAPSTVFTYLTIFFIMIGTIAILGIMYKIVNKQIAEISYEDIAMKLVADLGDLILLLLVNPLVTLFHTLFSQTGQYNVFLSYINKLGTCNSFILEHWFLISILVQLGIAFLFLLLAAKLLNPIKRRK